MEKIGWVFGPGGMVNASNPDVRKVYDSIRTIKLSTKKRLALKVLINLIDNEFDDALSECINALVQGTTT